MMRVQIRDKEALESLTPENLRAYLESQGWGNDRPWGQWGTILSKEHKGKLWEIVIPLRDEGYGYAEFMGLMVATLSDAEERSQLEVFYDLAGAGSKVTAQANHKGDVRMTTADLGRLEQVALRNIWITEAQDFTPWLAQPDNLAVLSDTLGMELATEGTERGVGPFRADILCRDTLDDSWVLIENQLERTDHSHLGQLLTYAAGLQTVTIVWVAEKFTDEHRAALDWLNEITNEKFRFFGLEIELWRIGDSPAAPKFNIVSRPNDWVKTTREAVRKIPDSSLQNERFWDKLDQLFEERGSKTRVRTSRTLPWTAYRLGLADFHVEATLRRQAKDIEVHLRLKGPHSKTHFALLEKEKEAIEGEIGAALEWAEMPDQEVSRINLRLDADPTDESQWTTQLKWTAETLEKFDSAFRERVRSLNAADWQPDDATREE